MYMYMKELKNICKYIVYRCTWEYQIELNWTNKLSWIELTELHRTDWIELDCWIGLLNWLVFGAFRATRILHHAAEPGRRSVCRRRGQSSLALCLSLALEQQHQHQHQHQYQGPKKPYRRRWRNVAAYKPKHNQHITNKSIWIHPNIDTHIQVFTNIYNLVANPW